MTITFTGNSCKIIGAFAVAASLLTLVFLSSASGLDSHPGIVQTQAAAGVDALEQFNFDEGTTQGWFAQYDESKPGINIAVAATTSTAWTGDYSLGIGVSGGAGGWWAAAGVNDPGLDLTPYKVLTAHLYVSSADEVEARLYILDQFWNWSSSPDVVLQPGQWVTLTWNVPMTMYYPIRRFGIQFNGDAAGSFDDVLYIDAIGWSPLPPCPSPLPYDFEDGTTQGWFAQYDESKPGLTIRAATVLTPVWHCNFSLYVGVSGEAGVWWAAAGLNDPPAGLTPEGILTAHLYVPPDSTATWAHLYILDKEWNWSSSSPVSFQPGQWVTLTWNIVPPKLPIRRFGIQFGGRSDDPVNDALYIDAIEWTCKNLPGRYDFECGDAQGWSGQGTLGVTVTAMSTAATAWTGARSLRVRATGDVTGAWGMTASVGAPDVTPPCKVTAHVFLPHASTVTRAQFYLQDEDGDWFDGPTVNLQLDQWNLLSWRMHYTATDPIHRFGIRFDGSAVGALDDAVYVDAIEWACWVCPSDSPYREIAELGHYHFEYGTTQGWFAQPEGSLSPGDVSVAATRAHTWTGNHSLQISILTDTTGAWSAAAGVDDPAMGMSPTGTVTARFYVSSTSMISWTHLYVLDENWAWFSSPKVFPQPGQWTTLTWSVPYTRSLHRFGVQFEGEGSGSLEDALYVDAIDWTRPVYTNTIYPGVFLSSTGTADFADELTCFDNLADKHNGLINLFVAWAGPFPTTEVDTIIAHHSAPMITWEPWVTLTNVVSGDYDAYIDEWAEAISQTPTTVFLRWGHEMNGNWYPWSGDPEAYKAAWRYIHDRMEITNGVENIAWVWTPNHLSIPDAPENAYHNYYPGDEYVDWVGASGYNAANKATWDPKPPCLGFDDIFSTILGDMAGRYDKPQMVPEFASACDNGCDKALWITEAYYRARFYPRLQSLVWFDVAKWEGAGEQRQWVDWRVICSDCGAPVCSEYADAYRLALADERYTSCPIAPRLTIDGPTMGVSNTTYIFTATVWPTATAPLTYIWQTKGQPPVIHSSGVSDTASFSWRSPGSRIVTVTAENSCGTIVGTHTIVIEGDLTVYLPLLLRDGSGQGLGETRN